MDHFPRYLSTVLLCLAISTVLAFGQNDWDAVLERYESISRQCLELRARVTAGEAVADRSVAGLLQELARLKSTLQDASGTMTPAQRRRFTRIRDSYAKAVGAPAAGEARATPPRKEVRPPARKEEAEKKERPEMAPLPRLSTPAFLPAAIESRHTAKSSRPTVPTGLHCGPPSYHPGDAKPEGKSLHGFALATFSFPGTATYDGMAGLGGRHLGLWLGGRSNFSTVHAAYRCDSDGAIEGGGRFWGDGRTDFTARTITGGPYIRMGAHFAVFAGGGFGSRQLYWLDTNGAWAAVSDQGFRGLAAEGGAVAYWRHLAVSAGINWLVPVRRTAVVFGIGIGF